MRLLIAQPTRGGPSSTFLDAHAARLSPTTRVAWGTLAVTAEHNRWTRAATLLGRAGLAFGRHERAPEGWERWTIEHAYLDLIERWRPDVLLAQFGTAGVHVARACWRSGVPLVVHFHGRDASDRALLERYGDDYRIMFRVARAIVGVSQDMMARLEAMGAPRDKLRYNPYGVDPARFAKTAPRAAPPAFLAVGRLVEKKAPHLTLRAFAQVHRAKPEARLTMIGAGPLEDRCRALAAELNIADAVAFLGSRPHDDVAAEMGRSRAFVQHSVEAPSGDREGTPVAILEATSSGLPVVATRHAGIVDVIREGETGLLVDEHDVDGMARHMLQLAEDPELAGRLGAAGFEFARERFSMERSISRLREILVAAMDDGP
jgi:glycosyltransferase involved in cell wall biosynthesis